VSAFGGGCVGCTDNWRASGHGSTGSDGTDTGTCSGHDVDAGGSPVPIVLTGVHGRRAVAGGFEFAGKVFGTAAHGLGVVQDDLHFCVFFE